MIINRAYFKNSTVEDSKPCPSALGNSWACMYKERPLETYPSTQTMWNPEQHTPDCCWQDFEPLLQRLSQLDQLIVWLSYHEYYNQVDIANLINCGQTTIRMRLIRIKRLLKILHEPAVKFADLRDTDLTDQDKFFLCMYSQCLGNRSAVARRIHWGPMRVRSAVLVAKQKLNGHPVSERLQFKHAFITSGVRGDRPPVRN